MSYQLLSETEPRARKEYSCIWCSEKIRKGEKHVHESSKNDGDFQDHRWHMECRTAADLFFCTSWEEEFTPHDHKRGTDEELAT